MNKRAGITGLLCRGVFQPRASRIHTNTCHTGRTQQLIETLGSSRQFGNDLPPLHDLEAGAEQRRGDELGGCVANFQDFRLGETFYGGQLLQRYILEMLTS